MSDAHLHEFRCSMQDFVAVPAEQQAPLDNGNGAADESFFSSATPVQQEEYVSSVGLMIDHQVPLYTKPRKEQ